MNTTRFHRLRIAVILIALAALIAPASFAATTVQAQTPKVLRYGMSEPDTIDPQRASYVNQVTLINAIFRGLLRYNEKNEPVPSIAKEVPTVANGGISKDGLTYTYKLGDYKWSDGKGVVVAGDFVYALRRLVDPAIASPYSFLVADLVENATEIIDGSKTPDTLGVKAIDDKTFEVKLIKPVGYLNSIMTLWATFAVRKDNVERAGDSATGAWTDPANGPVVGTGPFILKTWDHNKEIVLEKNPNFSGTAAKVDRIDMPLTDDAAVAYAGYKAGQLDVAPIIPSAEIPSMRTDPVLSKQLLQYPGTCVSYLAMNNTEPPFNNKTVRQAFATAIDRDAYARVITQGVSAPYYSFIPEGIPGSDAKAGLQFKFDAAKAKKLLADGGYPNGQGFPKVRFNYTSGANPQRRFDWFQNQFKQVLGVDISANPMDGAVFQAATNEPVDANKLKGLTYAGWCADYLHASDYLGLVMGSGGDKGNSLNISAYKSADFDRLAKEGDNMLDATKQVDIYKKAQETLVDDAPVSFMIISTNLILIKPSVKNAKTSLLDGGYPGAYFWEDIDIQ